MSHAGRGGLSIQAQLSVTVRSNAIYQRKNLRITRIQTVYRENLQQLCTGKTCSTNVGGSLSVLSMVSIVSVSLVFSSILSVFLMGVPIFRFPRRANCVWISQYLSRYTYFTLRWCMSCPASPA